MTIPAGTLPARPWGLYETQKAIGLIKNIFQVKLCAALHLKRVTAPLFVDPATGPQTTTSTAWSAPWASTSPLWVSRARWCTPWPNGSALPSTTTTSFVGNGLVADMNAIRRDEELDNLHSI